MKFRRVVAAVAAMLCISVPAGAVENDESSYFEIMANYAANLYIDESITKEEIIQNAIEGVLKDNPELMYSMIKEAFRSLDDYSEFYTGEEFRQYYQQLNKMFYGMGIIIERRDNNVIITRLYDNGGAKAAGLQEGDILVEVEGKPVADMSLEQISAEASGEEGTYVNVKIDRGGQLMDFSVERRRVDEATVGGLILPGDIGYIEIISFAEGTPAEFEQVLEGFKSKNVTNIILDLRNNPGGVLTSVVAVAKQIVPEGIITQTIYRNEEENEIFYSDLKDSPYHFAVLVNGDTASAAEVLCGALQDSGAGYVIGETTYGKGVIQNIFNLQSGDAFKITTGHYLTRNGNDINGVGIQPNEWVSNIKQQIDLSRYETFDYTTKWHVGDSGKGVLAAKQRLSILGYYFGTVDENFDTGLENAVYKFQQDTGLYPYGVLDISTQATLENKFYVIDEIIDEQFYSAYEYFGGSRADLE